MGSLLSVESAWDSPCVPVPGPLRSGLLADFQVSQPQKKNKKKIKHLLLFLNHFSTLKA